MAQTKEAAQSSPDAKQPDAAKPRQNLQIPLDSSKSEFQQLADFSMSAVAHGGAAAQVWSAKVFGEIGINEAVETVRAEADKAANGELDAAKRMLMAQAVTLDAVFTDLIRRAAHVVQDKPDGTWSISKDTFDCLTRVAFKAQGQCRTTLQTLGELVNPRSVAFIKQANMANGPQQVNNAGQQVFNPPVRAEEAQNPANELLEANPSERLDFGAQGAAGAANQGLEAMGAVHGAEDGGGKVRSLPQRQKTRNAQR